MRKQIFWLIIVASAVVIAYLVFRALIGQVAPTYDSTVSEFAAETNDRDTLETNTQLKFPANATDIHGYVDGFQDVTTLLRFTLPAQDFESFLQQTSCAQPLYQGNKSTGRSYPMQNSDRLKWWRPEDAQQFIACADGHNSFRREFFIDTTDSDKYFIYAVASTY